MAENGSTEVELAIDVKNLTFTFPSSASKLPALKGVDLVLPRGSISILIGSNGAGTLRSLRRSEAAPPMFMYPRPRQINTSSDLGWKTHDAVWCKGPRPRCIVSKPVTVSVKHLTCFF